MSTDNPYRSPQSDSEPAVAERGDSANRNLVWLLLSFQGRIPRRAYWGASIAINVCFYAIVFLLSAVPADESVLLGVLLLGIYPAMIWTSIAVQAKRWHDRDKSGLWVLISFIPVIGPIWTFIETGCLRGTVGSNRYGLDPTRDLLSMETLSRHEDSDPLGAAFVELDGDMLKLDGTISIDDHLAPLSDNPQAEELRLGGTHITDAGLEHVKNFTNLRMLDLSLTGITDDGLDWLLGLSNLTTIWLGGTQISDAGLLRLATLPTLREIYATNTRITPDGIRHFNSVLPGCAVYT